MNNTLTHIMTQTNELGRPGHNMSDVAPTKVLQPQTHRKKDENDGSRTEKREQKGSERTGGVETKRRKKKFSLFNII